MKSLVFTKNNFVFLLVILFNIPAVTAQYDLTGLVKDAKTKNPLGGVAVYIPQLKKGSITNFDGKFEIKNINLQQIKVIFSFQGYKEVEKIIFFDTSTKFIEVFMYETVFDLDEVIVSTGLNKLQKDNVVKVSHKSMNAMERKGMQNLMDGLSQIPGVSQLSTGTGISKPVIRGLTGNRVLVYNQGVRLENYQFGEKHGLGIDPSGISGIEVIKGPASLLYGSDALGGVVYLIPEKYAPDNQSKYDLQAKYFSNTHGFHSSLGIKTSTDKWRFLIRGSYKRNGDYQIPDGKRVLYSVHNHKDLKTGVGYYTKAFTSDLRYNYNHTLTGIPFALSNEKIYYDFTGKYQDVTSHNVNWKNSISLGTSHLKVNLGFSQVGRSLVFQGIRNINMRLNTLSFDIKWYAPAYKNWNFITGTQSMWQTNINFGQHRLLPNAQIGNAGLFFNINRRFNHTIFQGGLRYDFRYILTEKVDQTRPALKKYLGSWSGAAGIKQELSDKMNLRLNLASGFRSPNLAELTSNGVHAGRIEIGNPDLKNEQNWQTDINWDYTSTHIEFFINGFYNHINNYIYLDPQFEPANMLPVYAYRQDDAYLYGGEAGLHFHPHPWDWLHLNSSFETVTGKKQNGEYLPLIPADQWKNELRIVRDRKKSKLKKSFLFVEVNRTFKSRNNPFDDISPAYTLINAGVGLEYSSKIVKIVTNLSVLNLTNETYIPNLSVLKEQGIPNQGRNIVLSLRFFLD